MLSSIQSLRALAAWLVVFHHYMQFFYSFRLTDPISVALSQYGAIGVDIFFIISGFVIYSAMIGKNTPPTYFLLHRLSRIVPAYWIFTSLIAALAIGSKGFVLLTDFEPIFFLKSLVFLPMQNPSGVGLFPLLTVGWTLNYEMAFYIIFFFSLYVHERYRLPFIFIGVLSLNYIAPKLGGNYTFYSNNIIYEFLMGIIIAVIYKKGWVRFVTLPVAISLILGSFYAILKTAGVNHDPVRFGIPCALLVTALLSQEALFTKQGVLSKFGDWSYSTYLSHVPILCCMYKAQLLFNIWPPITLVIVCALVSLASFLSYNYIEKPITTYTKLKLVASQRLAISADSINSTDRPLDK